MHSFRAGEVILLLGAGASVDANIPDSQSMVEQVEARVQASDSEWGKYESLYNYIKSSIFYSDGIKGNDICDIEYNIEKLVNTLDEIRKKDDHPLFPFVGSWNPKLLEVAGSDFDNVNDFREDIVRTLRREWIIPDFYDEAGYYYEALETFQSELGFPLRVFSLNYDLMVEKNISDNKLERGFRENKWDFRVYDSYDPKVYLYKLHGSTDWCRDENGRLSYRDDPVSIDNVDTEIVFGTDYKLTYKDPFLYFIHELRKRCLRDARLVICVGYGFSDPHINEMVGQAIRSRENVKILSISPFSDESGKNVPESGEQNREIAEALDCENSTSQISSWSLTAESFMNDYLNRRELSSLFADEEDLFDEAEPV